MLNKCKRVAFLYILLLFGSFALSMPQVYGGETGGNVVYFFITGCVSCGKVDDIIREAEGKIDVSRYNVIDTKGAALFEMYCQHYNIPENDRITPIIFAGEAYFMGVDAIEKEFSEYIKNASFQTEILFIDENSGILNARFRSFELPGALFTGILNGLNPCSLSILILLATLISARELKLLHYGLSYCAGKLLAYFGIGTIFFTFLSGIQIGKYLLGYRLIMTAVCLFFMIFNFTDFLAARREDYGKIRLQLPGKIKGLNFNMVKRLAAAENKAVLMGVCFVVGAVTSVGEFFCTGQIYITTILSMIHNYPGDRNRALLFLFLYSLGFILPFLGVTFVLHKGAEFFDVSDFIRRHITYIKLFNIMIFAGILTIVWFF